jgi:uncharacterized protein YacL
LKILKEGKEPSQGVGYLDDGTMVVVEEGLNHLVANCGLWSHQHCKLQQDA